MNICVYIKIYAHIQQTNTNNYDMPPFSILQVIHPLKPQIFLSTEALVEFVGIAVLHHLADANTWGRPRFLAAGGGDLWGFFVNSRMDACRYINIYTILLLLLLLLIIIIIIIIIIILLYLTT